MHPELALRRQQFHVAPAMQQPSITVSTPLQQILKICAMKGYSQSFRITCDVSAVSLLESRGYIKAINNNNVLTILSWADLLLLFFVLKDLVWKSVTCSCNSFFFFSSDDDYPLCLACCHAVDLNCAGVTGLASTVCVPSHQSTIFTTMRFTWSMSWRWSTV